jgi:hypothetical protein
MDDDNDVFGIDEGVEYGAAACSLLRLLILLLIKGISRGNSITATACWSEKTNMEDDEV